MKLAEDWRAVIRSPCFCNQPSGRVNTVPKLISVKIQRQEKGSLTVISHLNHDLNHNSKIYKVHQFFGFHYLFNFRQSSTVKPVQRREK